MLQIQGHVQKLLTAAVRPRLKWDCPVNCFPSHWAPQQSNTELFEVDLASPEIASLMEAMHDLAPVTIVKVHPLKLDPWYTLGPLLCTDGTFMHSLLAFDCFGVCCSIHRGVHLRAPIDICSVCASGYCIPSVHQAILLGPWQQAKIPWAELTSHMALHYTWRTVNQSVMLMWQVHRIQNKLLWEAFAEKHARLKRRWSHEPDLDLVNDGAMTL